jgi:sigma-B regulation protein RsbU (phosphoserine phosphatase)
MTLTYVSAGHNPSLMMKSGSNDVVLMRAEGIALGVLRDIKLEVKQIALDSGDVVLLYTDGVTEAINGAEEQFGMQRLSDLAQQSVNLHADEIIKRIEQTVVEFSEGQPQFDDFTLMVLKIL